MSLHWRTIRLCAHRRPYNTIMMVATGQQESFRSFNTISFICCTYYVMTACTDDTDCDPNYSAYKPIAAAIDTAAAIDDDDEQCFSHKSLAVGRTQHCVSCTTSAVYNCRRHRCNRKEYYATGVAYWEGTGELRS